MFSNDGRLVDSGFMALKGCAADFNLWKGLLAGLTDGEGMDYGAEDFCYSLFIKSVKITGYRINCHGYTLPV